VHRAENTDHPARLQAIVDGLEAVAQQMPVVWPMHPRTRGVLQSMGRLATLSPQLRLLDPVGYLDMVQLEKHAAVIATDSGGVQKEAFFYQVPCVTLRDETEWVELVDAGWNRLVPPLYSEAVADAVMAAMGQQGLGVKPYGEGDAAMRIVQKLVGELCV
jgi:UDP-GlcNAc3NAcA epimerase